MSDKQRIAELEAALRRYGSHLDSCRRYRLVDAEAEDGHTFYDASRPCTCGYVAVLKPVSG